MSHLESLLTLTLKGLRIVKGFLGPKTRLFIRLLDYFDATHRLLSSSFFGLPYGILNISHKKGTT